MPPAPAARAEDTKPASDALDHSLERAAEQVFLSPRVVDQRSFDELTGALQRIVREASAQGKSLTTTGEQVRAVSDQLRALMRELQQRTDAATKVLPLLEAQNKRVQELTTRVTHEAALSKAREVRDAVMKAVEEERAKIIASAREDALRDVREAVRAIVKEEVERARAGITQAVEAQATHAERRTEAAATEISEQLTALRADAASIVADARAAIAAHATPPAPARPDPTPRLQSLITRAESLLTDLSDRVEAAAHAADTMPVAPANPLAADLHHATLQAQHAGAWLLQLLGAADQVGRLLSATVHTHQSHVAPANASFQPLS
jgi:hypothetical protein